MIRFAKGHGTENDFVLLPDVEAALDLTPALVQRICDRRAGVGADGVLRVVRTRDVPEVADLAAEAEWFMDYRNADGSAVEMCGNGIRVFARYLVREGLAAAGTLPVATRSGVKTVTLGADGDVTVDMGIARLLPTDRKVTVEGMSWPAVEVDMGNPHAVAFVDDLGEAGPLTAAPLVEPAYPNGVNVEFVVRRGEAHVAMRVHERGVGETRSCGTGACAVMVAAARRDGRTPGDGPTTYRVDVPGGTLSVTEHPDGRVDLTGPAVIVAEGTLDPAWLDAR